MSVADRRDWTYTRRADGTEWTTMPREDFKELHSYVEASSAFEDAYNAMQDYAQAAVWCMCEARWIAEWHYSCTESEFMGTRGWILDDVPELPWRVPS